MTHTRARLFLWVLTIGGLCPGTQFALAQPPSAHAGPQIARPRIVYVAGQLTDEQLLTLTTCVAASRQPGLLLLDSDKTTTEHKRFLTAYHADRVVPVGSFPKGLDDLAARLGVKTAPALRWQQGPPRDIWDALVPRARRVVVCRAAPRSLLMQCVCLAGVLHAPLYVMHGNPAEATELAQQLGRWDARQVFAVGDARQVCSALPGLQLVNLPDETKVLAAYVRHLGERGAIRNLVVANPADLEGDKGGMSVLAPWIALHRRAALLLTNERGDNVNALVKAAVRRPELGKADALVLVANLNAIPMEHRANPVPGGKDAFIEMEPMTPTGTAAWSFATGRLFGAEPSEVALRLARQKLLAQHPSECRALVVSNVGGYLPLLEAFSRNTVQELRNTGYETTSLIGSVTSGEMRSRMPSQDIVLWEGHHSTLVRDFGVPQWPEPLQPALVFLQSCLALNIAEACPFLQRGGIGVIGSSTRVFSGSGGAFTLAFFDAVAYDHHTIGGSLRHAKNFLLAYSLLKEKRLGKSAKLGAANVRTAWAFTLWGDPTVRLPAPRQAENALPGVHHYLRGNSIILEVPQTPEPKAITAKYSAQIVPNGRLAGLVNKEPDENGKQLKGMVFAEIHFPQTPPGKTPLLHSRIPSRRWVFCWDKRLATGYLLLLPRPKDRGELRFHIEWTPQETVQGPTNDSVTR